MNRNTMFTCTAVAAIGFSAAAAEASLLNLTLLPSPDITSGFIDVEYNAGSQNFSANGFALSLFDGSHNAIDSGGFQLNAVIDNTGGLVGGALLITGTVGPFGPVLLSGAMIDFGFMPGGGDLFEFLFEVSGGSLSGDYGGSGALFGVILNANGSTFNGDWGLSFNNNGGMPGFGMGVSDTAPIPAPAALPLLLAGMMVAGRRRV